MKMLSRWIDGRAATRFPSKWRARAACGIGLDPSSENRQEPENDPLLAQRDELVQKQRALAQGVPRPVGVEDDPSS